MPSATGARAGRGVPRLRGRFTLPEETAGGVEAAMTSLGVLDMLGFYGFDRHCRAKLVRHKEDKYPVEELLRNGWLDLYQSYQGKPRFDNLDAIVSFYGQTGTRA